MTTVYCTFFIIIFINITLSIILAGIINIIYNYNVNFYSYGLKLFITYEKKVKGDWGTIEKRTFTKEIDFGNLFKRKK